MNTKKQDLIESIVFIAFTYIITFLISYIFYKENFTQSPYAISYIMTMIPASMVGFLSIFNKKNNILQHKVYIMYFLIIILLIAYCILYFIGFKQEILFKILLVLPIIFFLMGTFMVAKFKEEKFLFKSKCSDKELIINVIIFMLIKTLLDSIVCIYLKLYESIFSSLLTNFFGIINVLPFFFVYMGEEYGWRYYLQPKLQNIFGKRIGVLILGIIWGVWHIPMYIWFYFRNKEPLYPSLFIISICIGFGVYLGFFYMKTGNIFWVSIIHGLHNINFIAFENINGPNNWSKDIFFLYIGLYFIIFLPFLLKKEYSNKEKEILNQEDTN